MFKTPASLTKRGNYLIEARCQKGHTVFKDQFNPNGAYCCGVPGCGAPVY